MKQKRKEHDSLGTYELNSESPWGIYTQRVLHNYPIVDTTHIPDLFLRVYIQTKKVYARINQKHGKLSRSYADAIENACQQLLTLEAKHFTACFPVSRIQSGGGTSTNMVVNEVIANYANKELGKPFGTYLITPNDHINASQSSNDTFPGTTKITCLLLLHGVQHQLQSLMKQCSALAKKYKKLQKVGRTHLQDAIAISAGDERGAFERTLQKNITYLQQSYEVLCECNFGGTATGSLQNITPELRRDIILALGKEFSLPLKQPVNYFEQNSSSGDILHLSSTLSHVASDMIKICNDLRLLASGPRAGINEIILPEVQAGSSIMPGKINPSIPEAFTMLCASVIGKHTTVEILSRNAQLQLQQFMPEIARSVIDALQLLQAGLHMMRTKCFADIAVNEKAVNKNLEGSFVYATEYSEELGYGIVADAVHDALSTGKNLREVLETKRQQKNMKNKSK